MTSLLLLIFLKAFAAVNYSGAQKVWRGFKACGHLERSHEILSCAAPFLSRGLVPPEKARLVQFIDMEIPFSDLKECTETSLVLPARPAPKETFYCLEIEGKKTVSHGYVIFVEDTEGIKIKTIKFKLF